MTDGAASCERRRVLIDISVFVIVGLLYAFIGTVVAILVDKTEYEPWCVVAGLTWPGIPLFLACYVVFSQMTSVATRLADWIHRRVTRSKLPVATATAREKR